MPRPMNPRVRELAGCHRKAKHVATTSTIYTTSKAAKPLRFKKSVVARKLSTLGKSSNQRASTAHRRLTTKETDAYLKSHEHIALLEETSNMAITESIRQMGLVERVYREQKDLYEAVLSRTCAIAEAIELKNIDLKPYVDHYRVESAGSFSCCYASIKQDPNMVQCSDPLCEIGSYHSMCLWAVELKNYTFHANLPDSHILKNHWMCNSCVAIRARGDFPELRPIFRELKRAAEGRTHDPAAVLKTRKNDLVALKQFD